ncbi:acyl-CoA dehydrogenase family protein [Curvibacter sp. APW13]|uniref:acyl-CoA dehydrogenase family protein n=1 Tax=Curvibacter sp. APW13 TaxID=3077236 RepID=UPI0028DFA091|nr:acyl-CoA dehydrogenase family protein [Curvibacter sp. APW13]MDT8990497.1 acyl-CoA dehydrogenase family protein [Curvibacter sp. APW13]
MEFNFSPETLALRARVRSFLDTYLLPYNAAWHQAVAQGQYPPPFLEDLKSLAREEGLWNFFLPELPPGVPGQALSNVDYAALAEVMGRLPWASEVFNCSAPDSGNMELLLRFANPEQARQWLQPLLMGDIRSAFAMSEPDVASSDPTTLQTELRSGPDGMVLHGRKWFITGAAHPACRLLIVMCRDAEVGEDSHAQHSMVLVPMDSPGVQVLRNIPVMQHQAPEGHCEIRFENVRIRPEQVLGARGAGFAMAQARLGPGRIHHCMRTIGQCELALELMAARALERRSFGHYLGEFANVQEWLADSRLEIDQARLLVLQAAWRLDQGGLQQAPHQARADVAGIKVVAARLQTRVVDRAMQVFGAMGLSPDTPLAYLWTWGRAMHLMDGPDEVHLRTVARQVLEQARAVQGDTAAYFTLPEQMAAPPRLRL